ncbi:MAG: hypothetical protein K2P70_01870 [Hyphomonadaceae bacterium]|nr:hypothetical protein [Hyphomonadaceae bacterium]
MKIRLHRRRVNQSRLSLFDDVVGAARPLWSPHGMARLLNAHPARL